MRPVDTVHSVAGSESELNRYLNELELHPDVVDALGFWKLRRANFPILAPLAEDLISAPASQAFVERIFSVTGLLSSGRRNRMHKSLEMRAFLKLNGRFLD